MLLEKSGAKSQYSPWAYLKGNHNANFCRLLNSRIKGLCPLTLTTIQSRKKEIEEMPPPPLNGSEGEGMLYTTVWQSAKLGLVIPRYASDMPN